MKVHKVTICIVDHDQIGADGIAEVIENESWPNHCINPQVVDVETVDIGEWNDNHPLNNNRTFESTFNKLFETETDDEFCSRCGQRMLGNG